MSAYKIKQILHQNYPKATIVLFTLDTKANLNHIIKFTPKSIIRANKSIINSVSDVLANLKVLEKYNIIKITDKHVTKTRVKFTAKLNSKFQSREVYKKKLADLGEKQHEINESYF